MSQCISPLSLPRPNGRGSADRMEVPCNKCLFCLQNKRDEWSFRVKQESKIAKSAYFITLTYDEENLPIEKITELGAYLPTLDKKHFVDFIKRLRKTNYPKNLKVAYNDPKCPSVRYYAVGEYGTETERPHYHAIIFNLSDKAIKELQDTWKKGTVHVDPCNSASIHYVTKYVITKNTDCGLRQAPFALMSRMPAIGSNYLTDQMVSYHRSSKKFTVHTGGGAKISIPKIYRNKIFSDSQIKHNNHKLEINRLETEKKQIAHNIKTGYNKSYEHFMFESKHQELVNKLRRLKNKKDKL